METTDTEQLKKIWKQDEHMKIVPVTEGKGIEIGHFSRVSRLEDSLFSKELAPHYMKLAGQLSTSDLVPKSFRGKPADLFLAWALGYQIGMSPEQATQCIAVVNGKAVMWGDEMLALCMSHREFEDIIETPILKDGTVIGYNCTVKRKGKADKESVFTLDMAKKAGLLAKGGVWNQYPERMLKLRARGFALRDAFPDALKGIKSREEVEDYIDAEYTVKPSRTEVLKSELKGVSNVDLVYGVASGVEDSPHGNEDIRTGEGHQDDTGLSQEDQAGEEASELHAKIRLLISETGFTEARLKKALKFYQVETIEDLNWEAAHHFVLKLTQG